MRELSARIFILIVLLASFSQSSLAQEIAPLQQMYTMEVERSMSSVDSTFHSSCKPYLTSSINKSKVFNFEKDTTKYYSKGALKLFRDHLIHIKKEDFEVSIDPLFDLSYGRDLADTSSYSSTSLRTNTRGIIVQGSIGTKLAFQTGFYESQSYLPNYLRAFASTATNETTVGLIPGLGRSKPFKTVGYDYSMSFSNISYSPTKWANFQFGYGKNFIGNGYRSLLLSDAAFNYPHVKGSFSFFKNKLHYTTIFAGLQNLVRLPLGETPEALYQKKSASFNYLSFVPTPRIEIGLFEGMIWQRQDSSGTKAQPYGAYIPIIGLNTAINGLSGKQNAVVGLNANIKITNHFSAYGQYMMDDPKYHSNGYQVGMKYFDLGLKNLNIQAEFNSLGAYAYANPYSTQSYSHYNQPLGSPVGGDSREIIGIVNYRYHRILAQLKYNNIRQSNGPSASYSNLPGDLMTFVSFPVRKTDQLDASLGLFINPKTNAQFKVGFTWRVDHNFIGFSNLSSRYVYVSLSTNILNRYFDF